MLEFGTIVETKSQNGKALAKVNILGRVTDWLPILSSANSFKRSFIPARINEQVAVLDDLLILGSIFNKGCSEPEGDNSKEITQFEDGTVISYDSNSSTLEVLNPKIINIVCQNDVNISCTKANIETKDMNITAENTTIKSPNIKLLGNTLIAGSINTTGGSGGAGSFNINGSLNISEDITTGGNANINGNISDRKGDLTNHTNYGHGRD